MSQIQQDIDRANRRFMDTFGRGDAEGMAQLYTADGQLLPTGSDVIAGQGAIAEFWGGAMAMGIKAAVLQTQELEQLGDTAIEVGRYTLRAGDDEVVDQGKYVVVWKNDEGTWKLHRDIWNTSQAQ